MTFITIEMGDLRVDFRPSARGRKSMCKKSQILFSILASAVVIGAATTGCGSATQSSDHPLNMAPLDQMPADVRSAPVTVQQAYQFAAANPDVMKGIPCYCGCGAMGHASNYACYVKDVAADGKVEFDSHALGCSICVDITLDTMRLLKEGKSVPDIKVYVDKTYAQYGPSNMP